MALSSAGTSLYVGGDFTQYRSGTYGANSANRLAKIDLTSGNLDQVFTNSGANGGFNNTVSAVTTSGTSLYAGGAFTQYRSGTYGANSSNYLAKVDLTSGNLDQVFTNSGANGGFNSTVNALAISGTSLYAGGGFNAYRSGTYGANSANFLAKVDLTSGNLDQVFTNSGANGGLNSTVNALAASGSFLFVGGNFTQYRSGTYGANSANYLAKVDLSSGNLDQTFTQTSASGGMDSTVNAFAVSGTTVYVGGAFVTYRGGYFTPYLGALDTTSGSPK